MLRNPRAKLVKVLGITQVDFDAAKAALLAFLDASDGQELVDEATARATHPLFANERVWNTVKDQLGL